MLFKITSRKGIYKYSLCEHPKKSVVISITDKFSPTSKIVIDPQLNGICAVLRLKFNDVSLGTPHCITKADAEEIANFVKKHKNSNFDAYIFHCEVGMCRSAGVCAAVMKYYGEDYEKLFCSKKFKPNIGCFKMVCEALGIPCSDEELRILGNTNKMIWENKTCHEKVTTFFRVLKATNLLHTVRHAKIKRLEKRIKK